MKLLKLYFVTKNPNKLVEARDILKGIEVEQIGLDIAEVQSKEVEVVVRAKAKSAAEKTGKAVFVEDTGFYIAALNGFPGALISYVEENLGNKGILKLMNGIKDRSVTVKAAIGYCVPGSEPKVFVGIINGKITEEERGTEGFGFDPIFVPAGSEQTYAEIGVKEKNKISHRRKALEKFRVYLEAEKANA